jgi:hypothetical protein
MAEKQPPITDSVFTPYGDKELWYITGVVPEGEWSLPLWVHRYRMEGREFVKVNPINLLPPQADKIKGLLKDRAVWNQAGSFLVEFESFQAIAHKAPGVTPACYRKWPGEEGKVPNDEQHNIKAWTTPEPESKPQSFLKYVAQRRGISYNLNIQLAP